MESPVRAYADPGERESGSPPVVRVPLGTTFHPLLAERVRTPIPWDQLQSGYCFSVVPLAAHGAVEDESSSSSASCAFCRRLPGQRMQDSEECAKPPAWTKHAFQMPSTRSLFQYKMS